MWKIGFKSGLAWHVDARGRKLSGWDRGGWKGEARVARRKMPDWKKPSPEVGRKKVTARR